LCFLLSSIVTIASRIFILFCILASLLFNWSPPAIPNDTHVTSSMFDISTIQSISSYCQFTATFCAARSHCSKRKVQSSRTKTDPCADHRHSKTNLLHNGCQDQARIQSAQISYASYNGLPRTSAHQSLVPAMLRYSKQIKARICYVSALVPLSPHCINATRVNVAEISV
jgi:hypothetical protein